MAGVTVDEDGREVEVAAGAVVSQRWVVNNREWIKRYNGHNPGASLFAVGNTGKTGRRHPEVLGGGRRRRGMEALELVRVAPMGPEFAMGNDLEVLAMQPDIYECPGPALLRRERGLLRHTLRQRQRAFRENGTRACSTIR